MPALRPPVCDFGWPAPAFALPSTEGQVVSVAEVAGPKGMLIMFLCNHCPFVLAVLDRILRDARDLQDLGIGVAAICSNDARSHPADSFEMMADMARTQAFPFPYLHDESQDVARAYGAVCTPDYFGFDAAGGLQYRGRLDASGVQPVPNAPRELFTAMKQVAETGKGPVDQIPSIGCSIKWTAG